MGNTAGLGRQIQWLPPYFWQSLDGEQFRAEKSRIQKFFRIRQIGKGAFKLLQQDSIEPDQVCRRRIGYDMRAAIARHHQQGNPIGES